MKVVRFEKCSVLCQNDNDVKACINEELEKNRVTVILPVTQYEKRNRVFGLSDVV